jgi:hypothetical protein
VPGCLPLASGIVVGSEVSTTSVPDIPDLIVGNVGIDG